MDQTRSDRNAQRWQTASGPFWGRAKGMWSLHRPARQHRRAGDPGAEWGPAQAETASSSCKVTRLTSGGGSPGLRSFF